MEMAVGLKQSAQIMGYVPLALKERIRRLQEADRWLTMSRQVNEAFEDYLAKKERELKIHSSRPSRSSPKE